MIRNFFTNPTILKALFLTFFGFGCFSGVQFHSIVMEDLHQLDKGFIGLILMIGTLTGLTSPFVTSYLARYIQNPNKLLGLTFLSYIVFLFVFVRATSPLLSLLSFAGISFGMQVIFPMLNTNIILATKDQGHGTYLFIRSIGTLGFAGFCFFSTIASRYLDLPNLYYLFIFASLMGCIATFFNGEVIPKEPKKRQLKEIFGSIFQKQTTILMISLGFANFSTVLGLSLIGNFIKGELGGTETDVSWAWTLATFAEVPLIWCSILLLKKTNLKFFIFIGLLSTTIRMGLTWHVEDLTQFYYIQTLHGIFYGTSLTGFGIYLQKKYGEAKLFIFQQYTAVIALGIPGAIAGRLAGWIWDEYGFRTLYQVSFVFGLLACTVLLLWFSIKDIESSE